MFGRSKAKKSSSKKPVAPTTGEAIQQLRSMEEMLVKKQEYLEKQIENQLALAKKNAKVNKPLALRALKKKKHFEQKLQQIDGTLTTIEHQREALEGANTNTAVLTTMSEAAKALKGAHRNMDVDAVNDMMDDIADQMVVADEISKAISNPVAFGEEFDEDDLEAELNDLEAELEMTEQEELDREMLDVGPRLPDAPRGDLTASSRGRVKVAVIEEDDMAELAAWAS